MQFLRSTLYGVNLGYLTLLKIVQILENYWKFAKFPENCLTLFDCLSYTHTL